MTVMFCLARTFMDAKCMVQNRTTSNFAEDDHQWIGLYGNSMEGANLAIINRRKPLTPQERDTYKILRPTYSIILDQVWAGPAAVIVI